MRYPYYHDHAVLPVDITPFFNDDAWSEDTAYNPVTQQRYRQKEAPNAGRRIWLRSEPGCNTVYVAFSAFILDYLKRVGVNPDEGVFCEHLTLLRYHAGDAVREHTDNGGVVIEGLVEKRAAFTALWYASPEDLLGGDFVLPAADFSLSAHTGNRIVIDAGEPHLVEPVLHSQRWVIMLRLWHITPVG